MLWIHSLDRESTSFYRSLSLYLCVCVNSNEKFEQKDIWIIIQKRQLYGNVAAEYPIQYRMKEAENPHGKFRSLVASG